ncbi:MAG: thioesterase family protein [Fluviicola sp.]|nr:thioesterase family protein [Fluviicola sp.]
MIEPLRLKVRFSDCDMMQHVNNAVYLNYFEEARIHYFRQILGIDWDWKREGILLRKNELEYLKPVFLHDPVEITVYLKHLGDKSFTLTYEVRVNQDLRTTGTSVLVCFDSQVMRSITIPAKMREGLNRIPLLLEQ